MNKKIIILDDPDFVKNHLPSIKEIITQNNALVAPLSDAVRLLLISEGIDCLNCRQFEQKDMYHDLYSTARHWAMTWYKPKDNDFTAVDSFSLGNTLEWAMIYFFSRILWLYLSVSEILKNIKPKEVLLIVPSPRQEDYFSKLQKVDAESLTCIVEQCIKEVDAAIKLNIKRLVFPDYSRKKIAGYIKLLFYYLNIPFSLALKVINRILQKRRAIIFFEGFHHFEEIMRQRLLKGFEIVHLQKDIGPSLLFKLYSKAIRVESLKCCKSQKTNTVHFDALGAKDELRDLFLYHGHNLFNCVWPRIEKIIKEYLVRIHKDFCCATSVFKRVKPFCLVVENDSTYQEKLLVAAAKSAGINTVIVQHGATVIDDSYKNNGLAFHDFYPLIADKLFSFGEVNRNWFIKKNVDPERITVTGAPRFDKYYRDKVKKNNNTNGKEVLIILSDLWDMPGIVTSHIGLDIFFNHIKEFINLAKRNKNISFTVRPHSRDNLWNKLFIEEINKTDNLVISRGDSLEGCFLKTDLIIGYSSTALIEALIRRIPVISLDTGEFYNSMPLWNYGLSRRVVSFEQLNTEMNKIIFSETERNSIINSIEKNIRLFNYNDDGNASERIAGELKNMQPIAAKY